MMVERAGPRNVSSLDYAWKKIAAGRVMAKAMPTFAFLLIVSSVFQLKHGFIVSTHSGLGFGHPSPATSGIEWTMHQRSVPHSSRDQPPMHTPCSIHDFNFTGVENEVMPTTKRFHVSPDSFRCRREVPKQQLSSEIHHQYFLAYLDFTIRECPPGYAASTFQLVASTPSSRAMGRVSGRNAVRDGCGIYDASVAVMESETDVSIDLFWTSNMTYFSNRVVDIGDAFDAHEVKDNSEELEAVVASQHQERKEYLQHHLDRIPNFPATLRLLEQQSTMERLSDCAELPVGEWTPVGVVRSGGTNDTSHWPWRSARCLFPHRDITELTKNLKGMRIKYLGDSHGGNIMGHWTKILCPEFEEQVAIYFNHKYDCPHRNNTFQVSYRFFRGVYSSIEFKNDQDGLSAALRRGDLAVSCRQILGLGLYNATIVMMPTWLYVYETKEGLSNFVVAIRSMLENCKENYPDLYGNHIVLLQTTSAVDSLYEFTSEAGLWRGIHNFNIEAFSMLLQEELHPYVDGIIPMFDLTYARSVSMSNPTTDGNHLQRWVYADMIQVQATAVISAMKSRGLFARSVANPRWFVGVELEG